MADRINTQALLAGIDIVDVIDGYVPLTKSGAEYEACCPFHTESTPSFKVSPVKQFYHCFGCGANGDAIKFLQEYRGLSFVDACKELGGEDVAGVVVTPRPAMQRAKKESPWVPIVPALDDAPEPPKAHMKRGLPERVWCYRDSFGAVVGYVYRFRRSGGGKETLPLVFARNGETGESEWHWMAFPVPRPLYGLDRLAARPDSIVLITEGEKCADAAHELLGEFASASWAGGGKAVDKSFWFPLSGRSVVLWPDCDSKRVPLTEAEKKAIIEAGGGEAEIVSAQALKPLLPPKDQPGIKTMAELADILLSLGCKVWMVDVPLPGTVVDGWDIADAVADGLDHEAVMAFIRGNSRRLAPAPQGGEASSERAAETLSPPSPAGAGGVDGENVPSDDLWRRELLRKDDRLIECRENVYLILRHHPDWVGVLWSDEFSRKIVKRRPAPWEDAAAFSCGAEWGEDDDFRLGLWLAQTERLVMRRAENISAAVGWAARECPWHPVREYLDGLAWDGVSRLDEWLTDYLGVKRSEYSMLVGRLFIIGMVARIYRPGCQMRAMPIFEGAQFRGKSSALRVLGGQWFGDTPIDLNQKDAYQLIQGRWLYEIAELDAFNRAESTRIKAFISSQEDRFRAPYDRAPKEWPRQTVFFGTTNQDEYFKDQTGNTRYWPLRVEEADQINLQGLASARDQLFAEAVAAFNNGQRWHPTRDEQKRLFEPEQEEREIADPWQSMILRWLRTQTKAQVTVTEIILDCLQIDAGKVDSTRQMSTRIGIVMKRLGWIKKRQSGGDREYYYLQPEGWDRGMASSGGGDDSSF